MPLTRPAEDTCALFGRRAVPDHKQQSLLAFVLKQLAKREPALARDAVELGFGVHARRDAAGEQQERRANNSTLERKAVLVSFRDMIPRDPYEGRTTKWIRNHPKSAGALTLLVIALIFGSIAFREWFKVSSGTTNVGSTIVKGAGIVAVVLFVAWRYNRTMRNH